MKHIFLFATLISAFVLNSCAGLKDKAGEKNLAALDYSAGWYAAVDLPQRYTRCEKKETIPLFAEKKIGGPSLEFTVDAIDILDGAERGLLHQTLYDGLTSQGYAEKVYNDVKNDYQKIKDEAEPPAGLQHDWSHTEWFSGVVYPELLVISHDSYIYSGGAHGENQKTYFVLDTKLLSRTALTDILNPDASEEVQKQINSALLAKYGGASGASLTSIGFFTDTAEISENFFVSREGLGFCWNPYKIAPYSMGVIEVVLPYDQIKNLLTERGAALFNNL
jgi:hypothetical protein